MELMESKTRGIKQYGWYSAAFVVVVLLLVGCESPQQADEEASGANTSAADGSNTGEAEVERKQVALDVEVEGAEARKTSDTSITIDYPVLKDINDRIPDWVINPGMNGVLGSVGVAPPCQLGVKEQLDEARLNARLEMAQMLELRLQGVDRAQLEQQIQAMGADGVEDRSRKSNLAIDRSIADIVLAGSRQQALWFDPVSKDVFVWMVLDGKLLDQVDHYLSKDVSVFVANTPVKTEYRPVRRKDQPPKVIVRVPDAPPPAPEPEPELTAEEELEGKLKDIETIPLKTEDEKKGGR